ncbi:O-antigen ligase family protein [Dyadobacter pollutisoli]|uniref:O-antigen ligase family protein n=1 Tax=Dyadobacter pollutisoli TaxID=2910158 RepID=A0A9E8NER5_9BACT|nr:O-antigen ligase family protein [Dyadobacter pollutisoli]WAC13226.1 O-antigen ligase family protein [Dyadobacter pollutisoli]
MTKDMIIIGAFDGLKWLTISQLFLAICFPLLNIIAVTNLFHEGGEVWATRLGSRVGAVGFFKHPGNLALYTIMSMSFFLSCYLSGFQRRMSTLLIAACVATVILTYSRTSFIALILVAFCTYYIYKNSKKNIFSLGNILKIVIPSTLALYWLIFLSPFSSSFIESDASSQYDNRMIHFFMAFKIFTDSPFLGVGLNAHLGYITKHFGIVQAFTADEFYLHNPIHNSHLIVLAETGIVGFILWVYFLLGGIINAKNQIAAGSNRIFSSTLVGVLIAYVIYGMTGWAPMSPSIFAFFLFYAYFAKMY